MKLPFWLLAILLLGWMAWSTHRYYCQKCGCCGDSVAAAETSGEPLFAWDSDKPLPDANFKSYKKSLLKRGGQGDTIVITGWYRAKEQNGPALALARATAIKNMLMPEIPESRIHLTTKEVSDALAAGGPALPSASYGWNKLVLKMEEGAIIEADNATIILFPFNSTVKDKDPKVDAYLQKLCDKHKGDNSNITIVGHTDNVGEDKENEALGLGRAKSIAGVLQGCGIAASRIATSSKGESEPVADNSTDDGRHQNRRVVITVNQ